MNLMGFEMFPLAKGVDGLMLRELTLGLATVVEKGLVCAGPGGRVVAAFFGGPELAPANLRAKLADGREIDWKGFLVYSNEKDLVDFLCDRYVPTGDTPLDLLLQDGDPDDVRERIRERVSSRGISIGRRVRLAPGMENALHRRDLEHLALARVGRGNYLASRAEGGITLYVDRAVDYRGHLVPRRAYASMCVRSPQSGRSIWFDGERFGIADAPRHLPAALYKELEDSGRSSYDAIREPLPAVPAEPLFLLRAPSRSEAASVLADWPKVDSTPPRPDPFFLTDTREPVPLPPGLPVVDDVIEAARIVARTQGGIYVPEDLFPATVALEDEPRWYLAHRVVA